MPSKPILDYYARHSGMTSPGRHAGLLEPLPSDVGLLARIVQGLVIHEYVAESFYGFTVPEHRKGESHIRRLEPMLDRILELDPRPLSVARPIELRLIGVCHHPMLLLVAMLRAKGIPARARCGFGGYFNPGFFEDHWLCEYWNGDQSRWVLADPQFDEVWRRQLKIRHEVLDVPRDRFLVAGDAWALCRAGKADPSTFGIFKGDLRGLWFVAGDLVHDVAALNLMEMLPWDVWGGMPKPDQKLSDEQLTFFDDVAALTRSPDSSFDALRSLYQKEERLRVPGKVFNAILNKEEGIAG